MPQHDGGYRDEPGETGVDKADVGVPACAAEQVPLPAERVGQQCEDTLPLYHQAGEVVRDVVGQRNGQQCQRKAGRKLGAAAATLHQRQAEPQGDVVSRHERQPHHQQPRGAGDQAVGIECARCNAAQDFLKHLPCRAAVQGVENHAGQHRHHKAHLAGDGLPWRWHHRAQPQRCQPAQRVENERENIGMRLPARTPEQRHAADVAHRPGQRRAAQLEGCAGQRLHHLQPTPGQQQQHGRPLAQRGGPVQVQRYAARPAQPARCRIQHLKAAAPGV